MTSRVSRTVRAALACLVLTGPASAATNVEAFAALPLLESPQLSPDGRHYASLVSSNGNQFLVIVPCDAQGTEPLSIKLGDDKDLLSWDWVNDEWLIIRIAGRQNLEGDIWTITRAIGVNARDAKLVPIAWDIAAQEGADLLWIARDGTPRVLLGIQKSVYSNEEDFYPEVFEVDVSSGKRASRARPQQGVMRWYADAAGNVRMGIAYHELQRKSRLLYRDRNGQVFRTLDKANLREGESLTIPALFLNEPGKALAFSDKNGFEALYELDLATMSLGREIFSVPGYDIESLNLNPDGTSLLGVSFTDTQYRTQWLEPLMGKAQRDLEKAMGTQGRSVRVVSTNRNQRRMIVWAGSASTRATYHLVDLDKRSATELSKIRPTLDDIILSPVRSIRYQARDGLAIEAVLTLPAGRSAQGLPLIVLPHGGPETRDDESFDWQAQYLAHLGYAVVQPNYRGSTGYGTEFHDRGEGQWGLAMQDDLLDAIKHLAAGGTVDPARVCIVGGSYGGYAALRAAQRDGASYRCAISFAGVADLDAMLRYDRRYLYGSARAANWRKSTPDLRAVSPLAAPADFSIPVLLVHGKNDLRVPVTQSRQMAEKLTRAGKVVRYVEQPLADHHFSRAEDRLQFLQEMTAFLVQYNPADLAPPP